MSGDGTISKRNTNYKSLSTTHFVEAKCVIIMIISKVVFFFSVRYVILYLHLAAIF